MWSGKKKQIMTKHLNLLLWNM